MPLPIPSDLRNGASSSSVSSSGNGSLRPSGPVSVDSLLAKQSASQQQMPKFMTKKQRMEQQQKAQKAEEEERQRREKERVEADREFIRRQRAQEAARSGHASSSTSSTTPSPSAQRHAGYVGNGDSHQSPNGSSVSQVPTGPKAERRAMPPPTHPASATASNFQRADHVYGPTSSSEAGPSTTMSEAEQAKLKSKYLGVQEKHQKKTRKQLNDRKTMFGNDDSDDTTDPNDSLWQSVIPWQAYRMGGTESDAISKNSNGRTNSKALQTFQTPAHWSHKSLAEMQERDWRIFREDFGIAARGGHIPHPMRSWKESEIPGGILEVIDRIGYTEPSPIQRQAIPIGLKERDLIGIAETGSGKTASFVIPMLSYISKLPPLDDSNKHLGPYALILAPTRELAQQIQVETSRFTSLLGYNCISIVGGRDMGEQAFEAAKGAEIVIATPGRLKDCVDRHIIVLGQCAYVIMDEADRMVDLGFEEQLNYILDSLPVSNVKPDSDVAAQAGESLDEYSGGLKYRVTMLYSATMPASVERMARKYLRRPATITIGDANAAVGTVVQKVEFITGDDKKRSRLLQILASGFEPPIIIFSTTRQSVDSISKDVQRAGYPCTTLHAGKGQTQREEALAALRSGQSPILVATDLAGRGIDVPDVSLVINFSMPTMFESYIHRIGRTGRAGKRGLAITFLEPTDEEWFYDLKQELARSPVSTVPRELERHPAAQQKWVRDSKRKRGGEED